MMNGDKDVMEDNEEDDNGYWDVMNDYGDTYVMYYDDEMIIYDDNNHGGGNCDDDNNTTDLHNDEKVSTYGDRVSLSDSESSWYEVFLDCTLR